MTSAECSAGSESEPQRRDNETFSQPWVVSRRGTETAVLVPIEQWRRLQAAARPSLKEVLLSPEARTDSLAPPRGAARRRPVVEL